MAKDRLALHNLLLQIVPNVYHQPPESLKLVKPCIVYKLDKMPGIVADNKRYFGTKRYLITVMDSDSDTLIPGKILELPYTKFETHFVANNLNHYVCSLHW